MTGQRVSLRQRRDLSQIIQGALNVYGQNLGPFLRIAAVVIPLSIATGIFQTTVDNEAIGIPLVAALGVGQLAVTILASAALIAALDDVDQGRPPDFTRAYDIATERFWVIVRAVLRSLLIVLLLMVTIIGIPWAIQRAIRWVFLEQAIILDGTNARDALGKSAEAVSGSWWRTFGIWVLISLLTAVPTGLVAALFTFTPIAIASTANAALTALVLPFGVAAATLLYFDLQSRKEPHDLARAA